MWCNWLQNKAVLALTWASTCSKLPKVSNDCLCNAKSRNTCVEISPSWCWQNRLDFVTNGVELHVKVDNVCEFYCWQRMKKVKFPTLVGISCPAPSVVQSKLRYSCFVLFFRESSKTCIRVPFLSCSTCCAVDGFAVVDEIVCCK